MHVKNWILPKKSTKCGWADLSKSEATVTEGFGWLVPCHNTEVDDIQKAKTLYSQVSFAVQRIKWKSFMSPKDVYAVSARMLGLVPTWHRFTQTQFCTFVSLTCHQQSSWLLNASWLHAFHNSLKFAIYCAVCWTTHGHCISSEPRTHSPNGISCSRSPSHHF